MKTKQSARTRKTMTIIDRILGKEQEPEPESSGRERVRGKITKIEEDEGWGFISSRDVPFTRIFFHWTGLNQKTLKFPDLRKGMIVEFEPLEIEDKGFRAIRIQVVEE